jgi:hypothetical protein
MEIKQLEMVNMKKLRKTLGNLIICALILCAIILQIYNFYNGCWFYLLTMLLAAMFIGLFLLAIWLIKG